MSNAINYLYRYDNALIMDYIYIDTSIFEGNNFLESKRINEILKLSEEEHISIILPAITYHEIKNRALTNLKGAISRFKKYRDDTRVLRNISSQRPRFEPFDDEDCIKEFFETFDIRLKQAKCIIIDYPTINVKDIFDKYFAEEFPFSRGEKKYEFPDAFAMLSVEQWCSENAKKCYVFSVDGDLKYYKSDKLIIVPSYEKYLDDKLRNIEIAKQREERLLQITKLYEEEKQHLAYEIENWLNEQLSDQGIYGNYSHIEIHDINIEDASASLSEFQIVSINDFAIQTEVKARIHYRVEIEIDDENSGWYDDDLRIWHFMDKTTEIEDEEQIILVAITVDLPIERAGQIQFRVTEINNGKDLKI